jgi:endonuclease YncB( thermonuclease family)
VAGRRRLGGLATWTAIEIAAKSDRVVTDEAGASGLVVAIVDGDTIKVKTDDQVQRVRVLGIIH